MLEAGKKRVTVPLAESRWWCATWRKGHHLVGSVLFLESPGTRLSIGGVQHTFDHPRWHQAAPADSPDVMMLREPSPTCSTLSATR